MLIMKKLVNIFTLACAYFTSIHAIAGPLYQKKVSITFDDVPIHGEFTLSEQSLRKINKQLLDTLEKHNIKVTGFVNEGHLKNNPKLLKTLLSDWKMRGHQLGNHTFSHISYHQSELKLYLEDIKKGAVITQQVLGQQKQRYFRPPYLHAGETNESQHLLHNGLKKLNLELVPVTMENADYIYDAPYTKKLTSNKIKEAKSYKEQYLAFTEQRLDFYERASLNMFETSIPHILMLHVNQLNADSLDDILTSLKSRGYQFQTIDKTLQHPIYTQPTQAFKFGIHWLYRWDKSRANKVSWATEPEPSSDAFSAHNRAITTLKKETSHVSVD
ncbi:polysaccharide deacetylase family protein [Pseudoalteromonas luteoviolacea]|uniref:NodB homology domain-containing protein n=1 Tax=Pseudoalteromonas luteoviolacea S4060-1 TaxID=1365257 RepID=A0A162B5M1_9GAMM|nr:polysaccharide deacetylase family protein [Pseudoalteromonas luteoviolacea]KZN66895.1 hypothetical protein N478_18890 [Pseudoalteromonas luteoviolacea S4060-1]